MDISKMCTSKEVDQPLNENESQKVFLNQIKEKCRLVYQEISLFREAPLRDTERNQIIDHIYYTTKDMLHDISKFNQHEDTEEKVDAYKIIRLARNQSKPRYKRKNRDNYCHSCNTTETPEWRRGPDGAGTLCNACGLHYSKLLKKGSLTVQQSKYLLPANHVSKK